MDEPQLVDVLCDILGLSDIEAETYSFLRHHGKASATEVARGTHQSRGAAYTSVRGLVGAGLAQEIPTRPITFRAMPVKDVLKEARRISQRRIATLEEVLASVSQAPEETAEPTEPVRPGDVAIASGRRAALAEFRRGIDDAQRFFWGLAARGASGRILRSAGLVVSLKDAADRGVDVRLYMPQEDAGLVEHDQIKDAMGVAALREAPPDWDGRATVAITEDTAFLYVPQPATGADQGEDLLVRLCGRAFAATLASLFSEPDAQAEASGTMTWETAVDGCRDAKDEVLWMRGGGVEAPDAVRDEIFDMLPAGVTGRCIRTRSTPDRKDAADWDERVAPSAPFWFLLVDGGRLYQAAPRSPGRPETTVRISEDGDEIRFYQEAFDRAWEQGDPVESSAPSAAQHQRS